MTPVERSILTRERGTEKTGSWPRRRTNTALGRRPRILFPGVPGLTSDPCPSQEGTRGGDTLSHRDTCCNNDVTLDLQNKLYYWWACWLKSISRSLNESDPYLEYYVILSATQRNQRSLREWQVKKRTKLNTMLCDCYITTPRYT